MASKTQNYVAGKGKFAHLRGIPRTICFVCKTTQRHTNPMARCFECKNKFCFSHIFGGQVCKSMKENDEIRDVCAKCQKEFKYKSL